MSAAALTDIDTCAELQAMADDPADSYRLVTNIDCTAFDIGDGGGFFPVGHPLLENGAFTGNFNGQGYVISGLRITRPGIEQVGLFGITDGATIERVGLVGVTIEASTQAAAIVGDGANTQLRESYATGSVQADYFAAGLMGWVGEGSTVENSYSSVAVTSTITDEHYGLVGGGLEGGTLHNTYSSGTTPSRLAQLTRDPSGVSIEASFFDCSVAGNCSALGGAATASLQHQALFTDAGWDFDGMWGYFGANGYPCLRWQADCGCVAGRDSDGDGTVDCSELCSADPGKTVPGACGCGHPDVDSDIDGALDCNDACPADPAKVTPGVCGCHDPDVDDDQDGLLNCQDPDMPIAIRDCAELQAMGEAPAGSYRLVTNIDCTGFDFGDGGGFFPVGHSLLGNGAFSGSLHGQGYVINGLRITRPGIEGVGLFGVTDGATIERVGLVGVTIEAGTQGAAIVGDAVNTQLRESYATGSVQADFFAAGLMGWVGEGSTVENSYSSVAVTSTVTDEHYGLVGGGLEGGTLHNTYSSGTTPSRLAQLTRDPSGVSIEASFFDCSVAGTCSSHGGTTTAAMTSQATYTGAGWDFTTIWDFSSQGGYPCLRWQENCGDQNCAPTDTTCNGQDDDCDGTTDDNYPSQTTTCGTGACARTGVTSCVSGSVQNSCVPGTPGASDTDCNAADDDCDGVIDESFASQNTSCGIGACARTGATSCVVGSVQDSCVPGAPSSDADCDAVDDDCDGAADDAYPEQSTSCTVGGCAASGALHCLNGTVSDSCLTNPQCFAEVACSDTTDNDGDGASDCADADCAGSAGCAVGGSEICGNSLDDDADGLPDCSDLDCDGLGPCVRQAPIAETVAPVLEVRAEPQFADEVAFLFTGTDPVQRGVAPGTLAPMRLAVVRGRLLTANGSPLAGVLVRVLSHSELGRTYSAADGSYVLAVNGGGPLTLTFDKTGLLSAQRTVVTPWKDYVVVPDVTLLGVDPQVTPVTLTGGAAMQVARGSVSNDSDGARQGTVLFPGGVEAQLELPSGTRVPITALSVRATEYTVGARGPSAMPASLPPETAYTYAVELSVDEAIQAGAESVIFSAPVSYYVEDFLDFPTGSAVPVGVYDKKLGRWKGEPNGRVIEILSISSGRAVLDVTGSGQPATLAELTEIGVTDDELARLASLYLPGQDLWRVRLSHFTIVDLNWPPPFITFPDPGSQARNELAISDDLHGPDRPPRSPSECGSRINCFARSLGEHVPIAGTPMSLHYESRTASSEDPSFDIDFGDSLFADQVTLSIGVAGQFFKYTLGSFPSPFRFTWNGRDQFGRVASGSRLASLKVCHHFQNQPYPAEFTQDELDQAWAEALDPPNDNPLGQTSIRVQRSGENGSVDTCREWFRWMRRHDSGIDTDFADGWNLDIHHRYDPARSILNRGDGIEAAGPRQAHYALGAAKLSEATQNMFTGNPAASYDPMRIIPNEIFSMDAGPDGSVYLLTGTGFSPLRMDPTGKQVSFLAKENTSAPQDPNLQTALNFYSGDLNSGASVRAGDLATAADGSAVFVVGQPQTNGTATVWRLDPNRVARPVRIAGQPGFTGTGTYDDDVPALGAYLGTLERRVPTGGFALGGSFGIAAGPDGSLYVADRGMVRRILPDGTLTTVVGRAPVTATRTNPQNVPAVGSGTQTPVNARSVSFGTISDIEVDMEGNLYIAAPTTLQTTTTSQGTLFVNGARGSVYKVDPTGNIWLVAGSRNVANEPAVAEDEPIGADIGAASLQMALDGRLLILGPTIVSGYSDRNQLYGLYNGKLSRIMDNWPVPTSQVAFSTAVSNGEWPRPDGSAPLQVGMGTSRAMVGRPDGTVWVGTSLHSFGFPYPNLPDQPITYRMFEIKPALPSTFTLIPSTDGSEIYEFDSRGRHLRTLEPLGGATRWQFLYQPEDGRLSEVRDGDGNATVLTYTGSDVTITAPGGQETRMFRSSPSEGRIATPAGQYIATYIAGGGLLTGFKRPTGNESRYVYTAEGKLMRDERVGVGSKTLAASSTSPTAFRVDVRTPENRLRVYEHERMPGATQLTTTEPDGTKTRELYTDAQVARHTAPDGTVTETVRGPDARFGFGVPFVKSSTVTFPSTKSMTTTSSQQLTLADNLNPFSITTLTTKSTQPTPLGPATWTSVYDGANRRLTSTSPEGRTNVTTFDARGRAVRVEPGGLAPLVIDYDSQGRVSALRHGDPGIERITQFGFRADRYLGTITGPGPAEFVTMTPDDFGRPLTTEFADGAVISLAYDGEGRTSTVTPPERTAHGFGYRPDGLTTFYDAPAPLTGGPVLRTVYASDNDGLLELITLPDARSVTYQRNAATGLLEGTTMTGVATTVVTDPDTGLVTRRTRTDGFGISQLDFGHDGALAMSATWSGAGAQGSVSFDYDTGLRLSKMQVGTESFSYQYDKDDLLRFYPAGTLVRHPQHGLITQHTQDSHTENYTYSRWAELLAHTASQGATLNFSETVNSRDSAGRILTRTEVMRTASGSGGSLVTRAFEYGYDPRGRLTTVRRDGALASEYVLDDNGNRLEHRVAAGAIVGHYDGQDRITRYCREDAAGNPLPLAGLPCFEYTHNASGQLQTKRDLTLSGQVTAYTYDEQGALLRVTLPDGRVIDYELDALGRRTGKRVNGIRTKGFLYWDGLRPAAELAANQTVVSTFIYGKSSHVPDYVMKSFGQAFRLITDHLGSVRLVTNAASGEIVQRLEYDEFGRVTFDSNPGFQPFGFAGGLYEADTGLVRFGARDYDAVTGRWTAKDPIGFGGGDTNLYAYVGGDPVDFVDPLGTDARGAAIGVGLALGADIGFAIGGGGSLLAALPSGGTSLLAAPGAAAGGAALGAGIGALVGAAVYDISTALTNFLFANKADIQFIDWLAQKYNLDRDARRELHDEITRQELSRQEIEQTAREIAERRQGGGDGCE